MLQIELCYQMQECVIQQAIANLHKEQQLHEDNEKEKHEHNKEMQKKAYKGEFLLTKQLTKDLEIEGDEVLKETMENTIYNKYVGKLTKDSNNEILPNKQNQYLQVIYLHMIITLNEMKK